MQRAKRPPDARFPFGYGKEVYFWSFVVAMLVFALGAGLSLYEGIHAPAPSGHRSRIPMVNYMVLARRAWCSKGRLARRLPRIRPQTWQARHRQAVQHAKDPTVFLVLIRGHAALAGLFVAFAGVALDQITGNPLYDAAASIVIGLILGATAIWLAWRPRGC